MLFFDLLKGMLGRLPGSSFAHVYHEFNINVYKLARLALVENLHVSWSGLVPLSYGALSLIIVRISL
jgi:hypothetical protein